MCVRWIASSLSPVASTPAAGGRRSAGERVVELKRVSGRVDERALDDVLQFSHVARPHVLLQREHRGLRHCRDPAPELPLALMDEKPHQRRDVVPSFTERRQVDWIDAQAVVQVRSEAAGCDIRFQVSVSRGNHAHIHALGSGGSDPLELPFLQHAQQLDLNLRQQIADLVQEDRPPSANSKRPSRVDAAPVNAPFS